MSVSFITEVTTDETLDIVLELAQIQVDRITDPGCRLLAAMYLWQRDWHSLLGWDVPKHLSASDYLACRQVQGLFSKLPDLPLGLNRAEEALNTFRAAEAICFETNALFDALDAGLACPADRRVGAWLFQAQRKISNVLGECPSLNEVKPRLGPGACAGVPKKIASRKVKLAEGQTCTEGFTPVLSYALSTVPLMALAAVEHGVRVRAGRVAFVPKNAKTDRAVVSEPSLNVMFQLGYGDEIVRRLARVGVNLKDQTLNQRLAREGSLTGALATLDLTSASDTLSRSVVWSLIPFEWAEILDVLRTPVVEVNDETWSLEKFSSMGNGFTFPLETLIFWGLCRAVCSDDETVSVYGDDIIVPSHRFSDVVTLLEFCGFIPNVKKSFHEGPFRESCGTDWLSGTDVRPFFLKGNISPQRLVIMHNYFARQYDEEMASAIRKYIPEQFRIYGPDGFGDGHLISTDGSWTMKKPYRRTHGYGGWIFETYSTSPNRDWKLRPGDFILPAYSVYARERALEGPILSSMHLRDYALDSAKSTESSGLVTAVDYLGTTYPLERLSGYPESWKDAQEVIGDTLPGLECVRRIQVYTLSPV